MWFFFFTYNYLRIKNLFKYHDKERANEGGEGDKGIFSGGHIKRFFMQIIGYDGKFHIMDPNYLGSSTHNAVGEAYSSSKDSFKSDDCLC
jgi:hypothetical protein